MCKHLAAILFAAALTVGSFCLRVNAAEGTPNLGKDPGRAIASAMLPATTKSVSGDRLPDSHR